MNHAFKPALWALYLMAAIALAGCVSQPAKPVSTLDYLSNAEAMLETGWETLGNAIQLGTVRVNSQQHINYYTILDKADAALDIAWDAYIGGDSVTATEKADLAVAIYMQIRPELLRMAGED